ncbi:hypothetical protein K435DRAFT_964920 [Dendrothele bispora CBS 962.96]|uniref:Uncharacterized protein n=1 Tax=Dendrothele bispora (strain CBS 962.96) TaxID=1314807 RepID=A0A4V4HGE2_DENBC|nr:hypothetical protein K435DRAFT_964920 [Dendrothele bispora CBS 962.96]
MLTFASRLAAAFISLLVLGNVFVHAVPNTVFIITNAETPSLKRPGLTPIGLQRADECIPNIFKNFDIGMILSCTTDRDGEEGLSCPAAQRTAKPLADMLGLNITTCGTGEESNDDCAHDKMRTFGKNSTQNILIVWDALGMDDLLENVDVDFPDDEEDDDDDDDDSLGMHPDVILTATKSTIKFQTSMNCTGIDGPADGSF